MVRDVAFGQYFPAKSLIHKLDPRAKIIMLIAFLALVFCTFNYAALAVVAVCTAAIVLMSGVPVKFYFHSNSNFNIKSVLRYGRSDMAVGNN